MRNPFGFGIDAIRQRNIELGARHDSLVAANNAILQKCAQENRDITEREQTEFDATLRLLKQANADLSNQTAMLTETAARLDRERDLEGVEPNGDGTPRRAGERKDRFKSFGEQLQAVASFARGGRQDSRLLAGNFDRNGEFHASGGADGAMNEGVPSQGGFLVGADTSEKIYQRTYATGAIINRCSRMPVSSNSNRVKIRIVDEDSRADGSRMGGVLALWDAEADQYVYSRSKFRQIELILNKLTALLYATDELLADAPALEAWIMQNLPSELAFRVEDALFQGTGVGQPAGVFNSGALLTVNGGATNAALSVADVLAAWSQFWHPGLMGSIASLATDNLTAGKPPGMPSAAWFVDQSVLPYLFQLQAGTGTGPGVILLYHPPGSNPLYGPYGELLGLPVIPTEHNMNYGTAGDILLADMSQYLLADKGAVQAAASMHVRFIEDEMTFRFTYRVDAQTTWKKPLTPKSGGPNLSPFVCITGGNHR